jgi:hypothetical protein
MAQPHPNSMMARLSRAEQDELRRLQHQLELDSHKMEHQLRELSGLD